MTIADGRRLFAATRHTATPAPPAPSKVTTGRRWYAHEQRPDPEAGGPAMQAGRQLYRAEMYSDPAVRAAALEQYVLDDQDAYNAAGRKGLTPARLADAVEALGGTPFPTSPIEAGRAAHRALRTRPHGAGRAAAHRLLIGLPADPEVS